MANQRIANKLDTGGSHAPSASNAVDPAAISKASLPDSIILIFQVSLKDYTSIVFNQNSFHKHTYLVIASIRLYFKGLEM
tara:strand:+ start:3649 stop:3888 length:240 start_codon:yes stop_codon:yes gene_type:complete